MAEVVWVEVASSNVAAVAWDESGLWVKFLSGHAGRYAGVPRETYRALLAAPSKGGYLAREVKPKYRWVPGGG